mgnify:CR=1 FL=1
MYAVLRTDEEVEQTKRMCDLWGYYSEGLDNAGIYVNTDSDGWLNLSEVMENIEKVMRNEQ